MVINIRPPPADGWLCKTCSKPSNAATGTNLKACARCRIAHYCSVACQRRDFPSHKSQCIQLLTLQTKLRQSSASLNTKSHSSAHSADTSRTREHCEKLSSLAFELDQLSKDYYVVPLLEKVLSNRLEALRLGTDEKELEYNTIPFTLLKLGREDQCVAFIKYYLQQRDSHSRPPTLHNQSSREDWLYGEASRFDDVFDSLSLEPVEVSTTILVALCMVKFRVLANDGDSVRQDILLERYLHAVHQRNPIMLPAMLNPAPLQNARVDNSRHPFNEYAEAYTIMSLCFEMFVSVPGVVNWLVGEFGLTPQYRCKPFSIGIRS